MPLPARNFVHVKRTLVIIRHAKADSELPWPSDFARPLTERGIADAGLVAQKLTEMSIKPDAVVSSPAVRAISTAALMCAQLGFDGKRILPEPAIYEASLNTLLSVIKKLPDKAATVLLFGHNPGFTNLANRLQDLPLHNLPTCGTMAIMFEAETWADAVINMGKRQFSLMPKDLR